MRRIGASRDVHPGRGVPESRIRRPKECRLRSWHLLLAVFRVRVALMRRYTINTVGLVIASTVACYLVVEGVSVVGGDVALTTTRSGIVANFMLFTFSIVAFTVVPGELTAGANQGVVEQYAMSPMGLVRVLLFSGLSATAIHVAMVIPVICTAMWLTRTSLSLDFWSLVPLLFILAVSVHAIGLAAGGLALLAKRVNSILPAIQLALVSLAIMPGDMGGLRAALPISFGSELIRRVVLDGDTLSGLGVEALCTLGLNTAFYVLAGVAIFNGLERVARKRGVLGHY